jgi:hypothetical protein
VISWQNGRGPDTVPHDQLPAVSEQQITQFLNSGGPLLGDSTSEPNFPGASLHGASISALGLSPLFGKLSDRFKGYPVENNLAAGIDNSPNWSSALHPGEMSAAVKACLNALDNRTSDPRESWLRAVFAAADAERLGCSDARQLALEWSQRGAAWTTEADFETAWASYKPNRAGSPSARCSRWRLMPASIYRTGVTLPWRA